MRSDSRSLLFFKRVGAGESHLALNRHRALKLPIRLAHDQHVVVRLEGDFGRSTRDCRQTRRSRVLAIRSAVEEIRRIQRHADRHRGATAVSTHGQSGNLRFLQPCAFLHAVGEEHQIAQRHAFAIRKPATVVHRAADRHIASGPEAGERKHRDRVVFLQRNVIDDTAGGVGKHGAQLHSRGVAAKARDEDLAQICVRLEADLPQCVGEPHSRCESLCARLVDVAFDHDPVADAFGDREHTDDVAILQWHRRTLPASETVGGHVDRDAIASRLAPLVGRDDSFDQHALARRGCAEPAGVPYEVGQRLPRLDLIRGRPRDLADDANARTVHVDENDVARLQTHVVRCIAAHEVVVDVQRIHESDRRGESPCGAASR